MVKPTDGTSEQGGLVDSALDKAAELAAPAVQVVADAASSATEKLVDSKLAALGLGGSPESKEQPQGILDIIMGLFTQSADKIGEVFDGFRSKLNVIGEIFSNILSKFGFSDAAQYLEMGNSVLDMAEETVLETAQPSPDSNTPAPRGLGNVPVQEEFTVSAADPNASGEPAPVIEPAPDGPAAGR